MRKNMSATLNKMVSMALAIGLIVGLAACEGNNDNNNTAVENTAATEIVMTETDAVALNDKGELVDAKTGKKLDDKDIKKLTDEGVIEKTTDGKVKINEDKNKKQVKVTVESNTGKVVADSTKTNQKATVTEEKKTTAPTEAKTEKSAEQKTEKKTEAPTQAPTDQKTEAPTEKGTEAPTEKKTEAPTEKKTEAPTQQRTEAPTEKKTEAPTQAPTEAPACTHNWVWKTHTETIHHDAVTHEETYLIGDAWDEDVYVTKVKCGVCGAIYENDADYHANDTCNGNYGHTSVYDHTIHHDAEYGTYTVTDKEAYDETVEVKDYQYCSKCGERR